MNLLENIRIFHRVAERRSFSAAAKDLRVTRPTVSKALTALERHLCVSLFRRTTRGLSITSEGQKLLELGLPLMEQFDSMLVAVKDEKLQLKGTLRITASLAFSRLILGPLLTEFSTRHPELKLHFHLRDGFTDLVENNIDVGLRIGDLPDSSLRAIKVGSSKRTLYASNAYLKKHGSPARLTDLHGHRLLYFTGAAERPTWNLQPASIYLNPHIQSDGSDLIREALLNHAGIALLPTWMMIKEEKLVTRLFPANAPAPSPIYFVTPASRELSAKQRALADFLKASFETIPSLNGN